MDTSSVSFNAILLLERVQLSWLPGWGFPASELALALQANPVVAWYLAHKCPDIAGWVEEAGAGAQSVASAQRIRAAEQAVLARLEDLLVYALDPAIYDAQPFLGWDDRELTSLVEFTGKIVIDVGAGTGRLALIAARAGAAVVFAVEPVSNLRRYLKEKSIRSGFQNIYPLDGLITDIPFPGAYADVVLGGHVFGDNLPAERDELERVVRPGGTIILCPANNDLDNEVHAFLTGCGYAWARFEEPRDGWKRKYWKKVSGAL
jgi:SAM-dependent methyltransferase